VNVTAPSRTSKPTAPISKEVSVEGPNSLVSNEHRVVDRDGACDDPASCSGDDEAHKGGFQKLDEFKRYLVSTQFH
jgi:hypothetical protein